MENTRKINKVIVHCSDSDDSLDFGVYDINNWHKERGFSSKSGINCGYHWIIRKSGKIEQGRPEIEMGAHCRGQNKNSIGICWIGRNDLNIKQYRALMDKLTEMIVEHELEPSDVYGHNEFNSGKTCPNIDMNRIRFELLFKY